MASITAQAGFLVHPDNKILGAVDPNTVKSEIELVKRFQEHRLHGWLGEINIPAWSQQVLGYGGNGAFLDAGSPIIRDDRDKPGEETEGTVGVGVQPLG